MKLEVEFTRHGVVQQHCRAIIEMEDAESVDRKLIELALLHPTKEVSSFIIESQQWFDVRDAIEKVDRMKSGS